MGGVDKLWADLCGRPLVAHSIAMLGSVEGVRTLVLVGPAARHIELMASAEDAAARGVQVICVEGGARRQDSVAAAIAAAPDAAWYLVHDGARPFASPALARRVIEGARRHGAAVPGIPVTDTVKHIAADGRILATVERASLRAVQTPQGFAGALLRRAHAEVAGDATDDAAMVEWLGVPVFVVPGDPANIKVTTPTDLTVARALLAAGTPQEA
ncbi:MAG: 2-C-methyl-D-erythritol 4-phosphate cytidylyltransferase [Dehalococcoidia bacterium]|nr:MAG: 2-C-methyl-D-erythritol 4-phosphate cytidylyltransferase [Dehalococcoidia bacterium]